MGRTETALATDQLGNFCHEHSTRGITCCCDEDRDRANGLHRPSGTSNAFGGYLCVCGGAWLSRTGICLPLDDGDGDDRDG
jgi:hypothetical protein